MRLAPTGALALALALSLGAGCKKKNEALSRIEGIDSLPASVEVVLGFNVGKLVEAPLVGRAVEQMFIRDPTLEANIESITTPCGIDPKKSLSTVLLGMGASSTDAIMVVTGSLDESTIATCVAESMGASGGRLSAQKLDGRDVYQAQGKPGTPALWFAFASARTVVVATNEEWLRLSLGSTARVTSNADLSRLIVQADPTAAIWAAGKVAPAVGQGLSDATGGAVAAPESMHGHIDFRDGLKLELAAHMGSRDDAKSLISFTESQLAALAIITDNAKLGGLIRKVAVDSRDNTVYLRVSLTKSELGQVFSAIDMDAPAIENPAPNPEKE